MSHSTGDMLGHSHKLSGEAHTQHVCIVPSLTTNTQKKKPKKTLFNYSFISRATYPISAFCWIRILIYPFGNKKQDLRNTVPLGSRVNRTAFHSLWLLRAWLLPGHLHWLPKLHSHVLPSRQQLSPECPCHSYESQNKCFRCHSASSGSQQKFLETKGLWNTKNDTATVGAQCCSLPCSERLPSRHILATSYGFYCLQASLWLHHSPFHSVCILNSTFCSELPWIPGRNGMGTYNF